MENKLIPFQASQYLEANAVLILAPHPDDEVFGCGGAIMRHLERGHSLRVVIVSDGAYGLEGDERDRYTRLRQQESLEAAQSLGYRAPIFWDFHDREVVYGEKLVLTILAAIEDADLIYAPSVFEMHPDHRAIGMAAVEAVRRLKNNVRLALYEVGIPLSPNLLLDISDLAERKMAAMRCFVSQNEKQRYDLDIAALNRYRTYTLPAEITAAEAFLLLSAEELANDPLRLYQSEHERQKALGLVADSGDVPLVSVIIRSTDRPTLKRALDSIALQTYPNIEAVVVNAKGNAHSGLAPWCGRFPLRIVGTGEALERSRAANLGLESATGDYLIFLDDDDTFDADHISGLVQAVREQPHAMAIYAGVRAIDGTGRLLGLFNYPYIRSRLFLINFIPIHAMLFSRRLLENNAAHFDENMAVYEDWDFWLQLAHHTSFLHLDRVSATYHAQGDSGVGLDADLEIQRQGREQLFDKWRLRWTGKEFEGIARYAADYEQKLMERDNLASTLQRDLSEKNQHIDYLDHALAERTDHVDNLTRALSEQNAHITYLDHALAERAEHVDNLTRALSESSQVAESLNRALSESNQVVEDLKRALSEKSGQIDELNRALTEQNRFITEIHASSSWRITAPARKLASKVKSLNHVIDLLPGIFRVGGGIPQSLTKAYLTFLREGWEGVKQRILFVDAKRQEHSGSIIEPNRNLPDLDGKDYAEWIRRYDTLNDKDRAKIKTNIAQFDITPVISVLMPVYNPPIPVLDAALLSVRGQLYPNWELCIADDASTDPAVRETLERHCREDRRIKVVYRESNGHISRASNSALELAQGEFVALFDHDDLLPEHALYWVADAINRHPDAALIFSDEDKIDESNRRYDPYFKSELNYELLLAQNMVSHLGVYRTNVIRELNGFRVGFEGGQDYDLALRVIEQLKPEQIVHIPRILYHWRAIAGSTALGADEKDYAFDAGRKSVADHLQRLGIAAEVMPAPEIPIFNRVRFSCPSPRPLVSIIIPTRDRADLLGMCLDSLIQRTTYPNYEVIILDNGSVEDETQRLFERLPKNRFKILRDDSAFNYSCLNNKGAQLARGEFLCLMNNDIEILTPDWLEEMVSFAARPGIGCVGARLWYPDDSLQHGGIILGVGGVANHAHYRTERGNSGYFGRASLHQSFSAVTGACLLVKHAIFDALGGLDEQLAVAFNDVDFCLRVVDAGYRNIWTPYAEMKHHESASRGIEDTPEKQARFVNEVTYIQARWKERLLADPAYSPNLTLEREDFSYAWPPRLPAL
ncbi:MAG: glycosyltransferase [Methylomonas sp.]|nr:glycosyltransferase [Methylomonas sp.]